MLANKNKDESFRDDARNRREENTNRRRDGKDDIICKINIDPLTFDSMLDPKFFSD